MSKNHVTPEQALKNGKRTIEIKDKSICFSCKSTGLKEEDYYCPNCGFPQGGETLEQAKFLNKNVRKKNSLNQSTKKINKARNILFILSGANIVIGGILGAITNSLEIIIGGVIGAIIYLLLGLWSKKKPFPAIISGFAVYIIFNVLNGIADPTTIYKGLIWKVLIISGFIYGMKAAKEAEKLNKELKHVNNSKDLGQDDLQ